MSYNPYKNTKTVINFHNNVAAALFNGELSGQISDGLYENRTPSDHWEWLEDVECKLDPENVGFMGPRHTVQYSLSSLIFHIGKNDGWEWTERILWLAQFASIVPESEFDTLVKEAHTLNILLENYTRNIEKGATLSDLIENAKTRANWIVDYFEKCTLLTDESIKKYLEAKKVYGLKELKADAAMLSEAVNVCLKY